MARWPKLHIILIFLIIEARGVHDRNPNVEIEVNSRNMESNLSDAAASAVKRNTNAQIHKCTNTQIQKHTNTQICKRTYT